MITEGTMIAFKVVIKRQEQDGTPVFTSINPNYIWAREYQFGMITRPHPIAERMGFPLLCFRKLEQAVEFQYRQTLSCDWKNFSIIEGTVEESATLNTYAICYNDLDRDLIANDLRHKTENGLEYFKRIRTEGIRACAGWPTGTIGAKSFATFREFDPELINTIEQDMFRTAYLHRR